MHTSSVCTDTHTHTHSSHTLLDLYICLNALCVSQFTSIECVRLRHRRDTGVASPRMGSIRREEEAF